MRILHVITWVAPGNPFGGPVTVAANLSGGMQDRGHNVRMVAARPAARLIGGATDGFDRLFRGFRLLPGAGFSGLVAPGLLVWLFRNRRNIDVVHVHVCRDLVALPAARLAEILGIPVILQPHGMVDPSARRLARVLDAVLTRLTFRRASAVLALTEKEAGDIKATVPIDHSLLKVLPNGVPYAPDAGEPTSAPAMVLYCSRLAPRKRPDAFASAAVALRKAGADASFHIVGADEGEGTKVDSLLRESGVDGVTRSDAVARSQVLDLLTRSDLLVLPAADEPYPMVVLEAMSVGRPVIITDSCGLADFVRSHEAGIVIRTGDDLELQDAMARLISAPAERKRLGDNGRAAVRSKLSVAAISADLEAVYSGAVNQRG